MVLVRAWVKAELEGILQYGSKSPPVVPARRFRSARRQHVQCIEVDEACSALKINDGETMVWCFVTKQGMHKFTSDGKNPSFASLNNKTITIDDWEFSAMSALCPTFDERKAKTNGHICILINKFGLFGGERTTTIGKPSDLGEGNRDLRAIWRALSTPKALVEALARGQGLTDLRDMDGVVMNAPGAALQGISWEDVEPEVMAVSDTTSPPQSPPQSDGAAGQQNQQQQTASAAAAAAIPATVEENSPAANAPNRHENQGENRGGGSSSGGGGGRESVQDLSQESLGMEYDGDFGGGGGGGGGDDFHTQAQSAGNVFSQEEMDMRPASPTPPSPPPPAAAVGDSSGAGGGVGSAEAPAPAASGQEQANVHQELVGISPAAVPQLGGPTYDDAPLGSGDPEVGGREVGSANDGGGGPAETVVETPAAGGCQGEAGGNGDEEKEEEESGSDPIPPGYTQLDVVPGGGWPDASPGLQQSRSRAAGDANEEEEEEEKEEEEEEDEHIGRLRREDDGVTGSGSGGSRTASALGKGKGRGKGKGKLKAVTGGQDSGPSTRQLPGPPENVAAAAAAEASAGGIRAATAGASSGASATQDPLSPEDSLTPQELSGATSSSSNIGSPNIKNGLGLSCLTQKRQNEERCDPNSGARTAAGKCDIRSVFRTGARGVGRGAAAAPSTRNGVGNGGDADDGSEDDTIRHARSRHFSPPLAVPRDGSGGGGSSSSGGGRRSSSGADLLGSNEAGSVLPPPDVIEIDIEDGGKPSLSAAEKAARKFPARPLQTGSVRGARKRKRPLSDVLVVVDPEWDGVGRPPVVARGADADKTLAEWLDASRPVKRPVLSIGAWLDKYAGGSGSGGGGGRGGGGGASGDGSSSSSKT